MSPPRTSRRSEDDYTPLRRSKYSSLAEEPYRGGQRPTPQPSGTNGAVMRRREAYQLPLSITGRAQSPLTAMAPLRRRKGTSTPATRAPRGLSGTNGLPTLTILFHGPGSPGTYGEPPPAACSGRHLRTHATWGTGGRPSTVWPCPRRGRTSNRHRTSTSRTCGGPRSQT